MATKNQLTLLFQLNVPAVTMFLAVDNLAIGYNNSPVSENLHLRVYKGDRIAIIGPNGVGKSTLLKTIVKKQMSFRRN